MPYISNKNGSVYQCVGIVLGYVNSADDIGGISKTSIDADGDENVDNLAKPLNDQIGIIVSPRGRILFGPANVWSKGNNVQRYTTETTSCQLEATSFAAMATDKLITRSIWFC